MDLCKKCEEKQKWLLEINDGSQVVCTCTDRFSEDDGNEECPKDYDDDMNAHQNEDLHVKDVGVQTPKRKSTPVMTADAPQRKMQKLDRSPFWMNPGRDIRRNLFRDYDLGVLKRVQDENWAILKVENIATSPSHRCIRRFYMGDKDGRNYLEIEFYPCVAYHGLNDECKEEFHKQRSSEHGLSYNPTRRALPCKMAISKINEFIVYNDVQIVLYNSESNTTNGNAELKICKELGITSIDISTSSKRQETERHDSMNCFNICCGMFGKDIDFGKEE